MVSASVVDSDMYGYMLEIVGPRSRSKVTEVRLDINKMIETEMLN